MTKRTQQWLNRVRLPLAVAIAAGLTSPASAFQFTVGDWDGAFDTDLTAAVGWRVQGRDADLVAQGNLDGVSPGDSVGGSSSNFDDGNLNFDRGDTYTERLSGTSELYLDRDLRGEVPYLTRVGGLLRGQYWFDFKQKQSNFTRDGRDTFSEEARDDASGGELADAFVWTDWELGNVPVSLRYGDQVFNWGESTFIPGGVNSALPVDVAELRTPGSEVRDALKPIEAFFVSAGLTRNLSVQAYIQRDFEETDVDNCGTFFSTNDFVEDGCGPVFALGGISERQNLENFPAAVLEREADIKPDAEDQYGISLKYFSPALGNTELGLYHVQFHSRLPLVSGRAKDPDNGLDFPTYRREFPEDIKLYGLSFNTTLPRGWSWSGEYTFKEDVPLQINSFELINGGNLEPFSQVFQRKTDGGDPDKVEDLKGKAVPGFERRNVSQLQTSFIQFFDQAMGASRVTFVGEVGATFVHSLPDKDELRFGRSGNFGVGQFEFTDEAGNTTTCEDININPTNCTNSGFVDEFSWGYVLSATWRYDSLLGSWNVLPNLAWSHDVNGNGPEPGAAFTDSQKSATVGVTFSRQREMEASFEFVSFFGGDYNTLEDRNHVNASVSYSF